VGVGLAYNIENLVSRSLKQVEHGPLRLSFCRERRRQERLPVRELVVAPKRLNVINVGAAGTFVVRGGATAPSIRREILARLSLQPQIVVRLASEVAALLQSKPFDGPRFSKNVRVGGGTLRTTEDPAVAADRLAGG